VRARQQAMTTDAFTMMSQMIDLSGLIFPIESMPLVIRLGDPFEMLN
jgi:hypothetical protein